jgi:peptide/nickel transport system ATP-binding protein
MSTPAPPEPVPPVPALRVAGLTVDYRSAAGAVRVVRDVGFELYRGRVLGLVGESGSGKSTAALAAIGWSDAGLHRVAGTSVLDGVDLCGSPPGGARGYWGRRIGYVPQDIGGALHPTYRIGSQLRETLRVNAGLSRAAADERAARLLASVNLPDPVPALRRYPHEFSGGQQQRIALALALAPDPDVLVLDEPTTGLDVGSQRMVATVLRELVRARSVAVLFITHDLALLAEIAEDIAVMYAGEVVECGPAATVLHRPRHPYTRALLDAVPSPVQAVTTRGIPGVPPGQVVAGRCGFAARCGYAQDRCRAGVPDLRAVPDGRLVRCVRARELRLESVTERRREPAAEATATALDVIDLSCGYRTGAGYTTAVSRASLRVPTGSVTALVGESGSGKSTLGRAVAGLLRPRSGQIWLAGVRLPADPRRRTREQRHHIQLIFQNPGTALNPRRTAGDHLRHVAARFIDGDRGARREAVAQTLDAVQLGPAVLDRYPGQLSGGQRQRVAIAAAFVTRPRLVVCDEITSGQDVSVQAAILATLADLQQRLGTSVLFISHDLGVVRSIADHLYVMQRGEIVESGATEPVFGAPGHAYTRELLAAVPVVRHAAAAEAGREVAG